MTGAEIVTAGVAGGWADPQDPTEHWGRSLVRLLDELGPIEMVDPEITDPVEWVKAQSQNRKTN